MDTAFTIYSQLLALLTIFVLVAVHFSCILPQLTYIKGPLLSASCIISCD